MTCKFRTAYDLGDYNDDESYVDCESITEQGQVQSIQQILARCLRGEYVPTDNLYYENEKVTSIEEAFANEDPTQSDGFDLVDAGNIIAGIQASSEASQGGASEATSETGSDATADSEAKVGAGGTN